MVYGLAGCPVECIEEPSGACRSVAGIYIEDSLLFTENIRNQLSVSGLNRKIHQIFCQFFRQSQILLFSADLIQSGQYKPGSGRAIDIVRAITAVQRLRITFDTIWSLLPVGLNIITATECQLLCLLKLIFLCRLQQEQDHARIADQAGLMSPVDSLLCLNLRLIQILHNLFNRLAIMITEPTPPIPK